MLTHFRVVNAVSHGFDFAVISGFNLKCFWSVVKGSLIKLWPRFRPLLHPVVSPSCRGILFHCFSFIWKINLLFQMRGRRLDQMMHKLLILISGLVWSCRKLRLIVETLVWTREIRSLGSIVAKFKLTLLFILFIWVDRDVVNVQTEFWGQVWHVGWIFIVQFCFKSLHFILLNLDVENLLVSIRFVIIVFALEEVLLVTAPEILFHSGACVDVSLAFSQENIFEFQELFGRKRFLPKLERLIKFYHGVQLILFDFVAKTSFTLQLRNIRLDVAFNISPLRLLSFEIFHSISE